MRLCGDFLKWSWNFQIYLILIIRQISSFLLRSYPSTGLVLVVINWHVSVYTQFIKFMTSIDIISCVQNYAGQIWLPRWQSGCEKLMLEVLSYSMYPSSFFLHIHLLKRYLIFITSSLFNWDQAVASLILFDTRLLSLLVLSWLYVDVNIYAWTLWPQRSRCNQADDDWLDAYPSSDD